MFEEIYENVCDFYNPFKCIGDLGEKWCNFKWCIQNLHLNPMRRIQSPVFTTRLLQNTHWYLKVELLNPGDLRNVEISLNRLRKRENTTLIVDVYFKIICEKEVMCSMYTHEYDPERLQEYGRIHTVSLNKAKNNDLIFDCKLRPNKTMIQNVCHHDLDASLPIHLRRLLQTGEHFDTVIRVGNYQLKAHIAILQARLPQLLKSSSPTKEDGKYVVNINDDLSLPIVKEMLKYAYTGQAYVDVESYSIRKDVYVRYGQNFFQSCCWEDHPSAKTFFNYETDSLLWHLKDVFKKSNLGSQRIELLKLLPNKFTFSLDVDESEKDEKCLMITIQFLHKIIPKPTIVSCNSLLVNREINKKLELGETKCLLEYNTPKRKMKLCSLLDVKKGFKTLSATSNSLVLQTDLKFCCGSSRSSIENIYGGQFDVTKCTGCPLLSADMKALFTSQHLYNIIVESGDGVQIPVHKAILLARWPEVDKLELKEKTHVVIADSQNQSLYDFLLWLYTGRVNVDVKYSDSLNFLTF